MVEPPHEHAAAVLVAVEDVEPPERAVELQGLAHQLAHHLPQRLVVPGGRQVALQDVGVQVEAGIDLPVGVSLVVEDALAEAPDGQQALFEDRTSGAPATRFRSSTRQPLMIIRLSGSSIRNQA